MTLTKAQIAKAVWNKTEIPKQRTAELVDTIFEVMKQTLESGEDVLIARNEDNLCLFAAFRIPNDEFSALDILEF